MQPADESYTMEESGERPYQTSTTPGVGLNSKPGSSSCSTAVGPLDSRLESTTPPRSPSAPTAWQAPPLAEEGEDPFPPGDGYAEEQYSAEPMAWPQSTRSSNGERKSDSQRWARSTEDSLRQASTILQNARLELQDTHNKSERIGKPDSRGGVQGILRTQMEATSDQTKAIEERLESIEDSSRQTSECLFQLKRAYRSKWSALNICERRLELRDQRPLQELVRDSLQVALEQERQALISARQQLQDHIQRTMEMMAALDALKNSLLEDLHTKRHSYRQDRSCLILRPGGNGKDKGPTVLPKLHEVPHYVPPASPRGADSTGMGQQSTAEGKVQSALIVRALTLEDNALRLCNENDAAMLHAKLECDGANAHTRAALECRIRQLELVRNKLESQLSETNETIESAELSLARTKKQLDNQEAPLRKLDRLYASRLARGEEGANATLDGEMNKQLGHVKVSVTTLTGKYQKIKGVVSDLRESKTKLAEEIRCKTLALKIEDKLRKLTSKKAIELDRQDPCSGRLSKRGASKNF